jgi:hypothetical protein
VFKKLEVVTVVKVIVFDCATTYTHQGQCAGSDRATTYTNHSSLFTFKEDKNEPSQKTPFNSKGVNQTWQTQSVVTHIGKNSKVENKLL